MSIYNTPLGYFYYVKNPNISSHNNIMNELETMKKIAFNIKVERMRAGLTQFQLAELIDVHEKYIGRVESGKQNITIKTLIKLANALNVNLKKLVDIE